MAKSTYGHLEEGEGNGGHSRGHGLVFPKCQFCIFMLGKSGVDSRKASNGRGVAEFSHAGNAGSSPAGTTTVKTKT